MPSAKPKASKPLSSEKKVPVSLAAEQSVLGGLMLDNSTWDDVCDILSKSDFYQMEHGLIFEAMMTLSRSNKPFDVITIKEVLSSNDQLKQVGGEVFLYELANNTPSVENVRAYAQIVREQSVLRSLIEAATGIADLAYRPENRAASELIDIAEQKIFAIGERQQSVQTGPQHVQTFLTKTVEKIDELSQSDNPITGVATGFVDLDHLTAGL